MFWGGLGVSSKADIAEPNVFSMSDSAIGSPTDHPNTTLLYGSAFMRATFEFAHISGPTEATDKVFQPKVN